LGLFNKEVLNFLPLRQIAQWSIGDGFPVFFSIATIMFRYEEERGWKRGRKVNMFEIKL
jgi:hypothetical protein